MQGPRSQASTPGQVVEGAGADERGFPFERRLPPPDVAARATLRLFFGLFLHASQNHTPSGATSSPIHPKWNCAPKVSDPNKSLSQKRVETRRDETRLTHSRSHSVSSHATMSPKLPI